MIIKFEVYWRGSTCYMFLHWLTYDIHWWTVWRSLVCSSGVNAPGFGVQFTRDLGYRLKHIETLSTTHLLGCKFGGKVDHAVK